VVAAGTDPHAPCLAAGIILEYQLKDGTREMKEIDLLHLTAEYVRLGAWRARCTRPLWRGCSAARCDLSTRSFVPMQRNKSQLRQIVHKPLPGAWFKSKPVARRTTRVVAAPVQNYYRCAAGTLLGHLNGNSLLAGRAVAVGAVGRPGVCAGVVLLNKILLGGHPSATRTLPTLLTLPGK
jgi:hypothetical protein